MTKNTNSNQPITMTVFAQAIWNDSEGNWEVSLTSNRTGILFPSGKYGFVQEQATIKVNDCDEYVIADALLHLNGINIQKLYNSTDNPIVGQE